MIMINIAMTPMTVPKIKFVYPPICCHDDIDEALCSEKTALK